MKASHERSWRLNDDIASTDIESGLTPHFAFEWHDGPTSSMTLFDDADAALWLDGYLLYSHGGEKRYLARDGVLVAETDASAAAKFWWDYPVGMLRDALRPLVGVRALVPVATHDVHERHLLVYNVDHKIVVRANLTTSAVGGRVIRYLTVEPLRGYDIEFLAVCRYLKPLLSAKAHLGMRDMLAGHDIAAWTPRQAVAMPISAEMATEQAVRAMGHTMLEEARQYVPGVVNDVDTEFLHAFRVGLRKTRSLVSLLKKALPDATLEKIKPRLSALAGKTNRLRDLDVYLLAQHEYVALLPDDSAAGMAELTALVRTQREKAYWDVAAYFGSPTFEADIDACLAELSLRPVLEKPAASKPVLALVKRELLKRYAALQALSSRLHADSADEDIHALRIEFKKLRYLIEFFLDLLPRKRTQRLLGDLKKIQGVLGSFNDLSVQIDFLNAFRAPERPGMTKALDGLTAILHLKKLDMRERIVDALRGYFTENRAIEFDLVFGPRHRKEAA
jgi:CHAD domain-containing protein